MGCQGNGGGIWHAEGGVKGERARHWSRLSRTRRRSYPPPSPPPPSASSTEKRPARETRRWWMHYWYDERSAGGLEQREEMPPPCHVCGGAVTSTFHIHRDSRTYPRGYITSRLDRSRAFRFRLIRTRGCFYKVGSNRRLLSDVLARDGTGWGLNGMIERSWIASRRSA